MDQQEKVIERLKKQIDDQMKINEEQKKVNDEKEKEIKEIKEKNEKLDEKIKEQMKMNDSIKQNIEDLKNENKKKREEDQMKLQKQKEEYQNEIDHLKKQKDELMLKQNKAEKDINLIFNRSAPYQIQDFKQFSEFQNTLKIFQTQNLKQNETFQKEIEKILNKINEISNEYSNENQKINQISNENKNLIKNIQKGIQINQQTFQKEIKEIKENLEIFNKNLIKEKLLEKVHKLILFKYMKSDIIKCEELDLIEEGIRKNLNKKIKEYKLLFKAKRDGFGSKDFHSKCDNKSYTVSFVKSKEGKRFGGFTDVEWDQSGWKKGSNGFIFSLDNNEIYYNKYSSYNIYCYSNLGPTFGGGFDFCISNNCDKNKYSYDNSSHSYDIKGKKYALAGKHKFYVEDYEVYKKELE